MKVYDNDKAQDVTQVVECLHKTPGSDSSTIAGTTAHACNTWEIEYSSKEVTKEKKKDAEAIEMSQHIKTLAANPDDLIWIPRNHMMREQT